MWAIGTEKVGKSNYKILFRDNKSKKWKAIKGGAVKLAVDEKGEPWVITSSKKLYKYNSQTEKWKGYPGRVTEIAIGPGG